MMVKDNSHECRLVNVEAQLQFQKEEAVASIRDKSTWALADDSDSDMPHVEIQFENGPFFHDTNSATREVPSTVFLTSSSSSAIDESAHLIASAPEAPTDPSESNEGCAIQSSSGFSLGDILSGATTASANNSTGSPTSSFFPDWGLNKKEADDASVTSAAYFDPSDFSPRTWSNLLTEQEVVLGLAVIYLTISLTHPLLFLAGALTALSTATAVGAGYDFLVEGPLRKCLCGYYSDSTATTAGEATIDSPAEQEGRLSSFPASAPDISTPILSIEEKPGKGQPEAPTSLPPSVPTTDEEERLTTTEEVAFAPTSTMNTFSTMAEYGLHENWIEVHYPPLDHPVIEKHEFMGLSVKHFFEVFLADDAPYNYREFQKKRGDKNIEYGSWSSVFPKTTDEEILTTLSLHPEATGSFPHELEYDEFLTRKLHFQAKTNNSFLGPPYATTTKEQRLLLVNKKLGILEMKTTLADIPFCDRFYVMERWILKAEKSSDGTYRCYLSTCCQVFFVKSCPFESQIRTKTKSSLNDVSTAWLHMASKALVLSEKHKEERIRQQQDLLMDGPQKGKMDKDEDRCEKSNENTSPATDHSDACTQHTEVMTDFATVDEEGMETFEVTESDMYKTFELFEQALPETKERKHRARRRAFSSMSSSSSVENGNRRNAISRLGRLVSPQRRRSMGGKPRSEAMLNSQDEGHRRSMSSVYT